MFKYLTAALIAFSLIATPLVKAQDFIESDLVEPDPMTADSLNPSPIISLTAVPPRLGDDYSLVVQPGQTIETVIEVRNPTEASALVESRAVDFYVGSDGETPVAVENDQANPRWQLSQWLTLTPNTDVLEPRGTSTILVTIAVPADALPGGRYAMILHKPITTSGTIQTTGAQVSAQVGTLLYVIVDGPLTQKAEISNFSLPGFSETGPIPYSLKVNNYSSFHLRPNLTLTITNLFGQEVAQIPLASQNIFPDGQRAFAGEWQKSWGFGLYHAKVTGDYGTTNITGESTELTASASFWIFPVRLVALIIGIILIIVLLFISARKKNAKILALEEAKVRQLEEKLQQARQANLNKPQDEKSS